MANELQEGEWVELVRKDGKTIEGKYVEVNSDSIPVIKLKMPGKKANQMIWLSDIDHIVIGSKSIGPRLTGTLLGKAVDVIVWTMIAVAMNNAVGQ